jgi:hypothetical protein
VNHPIRVIAGNDRRRENRATRQGHYDVRWWWARATIGSAARIAGCIVEVLLEVKVEGR